MLQKKPDHLGWKRSVLVIVPLRLGMESVAKEHYKAIKSCFSSEIPQAVGILGGRPNQALYYVGHQDDELIFLDPHFV